MDKAIFILWSNGRKQRLQKHFESGGAMAKRGTLKFCIWPKSNDFTERKCLEICRKWPLPSLIYLQFSTERAPPPPNERRIWDQIVLKEPRPRMSDALNSVKTFRRQNGDI
jgi:hypothetical protein